MPSEIAETVSDPFARLFAETISLGNARDSHLFGLFAISPFNPLILRRLYPETVFTDINALLEAFREVPRDYYLHPEFRTLSLTDIVIPIWHTAEAGSIAEQAWDAFQRQDLDAAAKYCVQIGKLSGGVINTSQPSIMQFALALANIKPGSIVREVGSGCGYNLALMARLAYDGQVEGMEINHALAKYSQEKIALTGLKNITVQCGDAKEIAPAQPLDAIIVSATTTEAVALQMTNHLNNGGRLVAPIQNGDSPGSARYHVYTRENGQTSLLITTTPEVNFVTLS
ncbi:class I SAM-dependent methyltransferase [Candidatus Woesearchaeota archaeon]|nr:class I SAM-dependent methyltransferase [Candidatus Woesearchaeota archaeon]